MIRCCLGCKPPKRTPYCHSTCPEYIAEDAKNREEREARNREKGISCGLYEASGRQIEKQIRHRRNSR